MCGIVGFVSKDKSLDTLEEMLKIQAYRGPDDRGIYFDESSGVHLGHNRLSILDLSSAGHQPFISPCGNYVIVFNGEVYNFADIKQELLQLGYKFKSNSDTEVILYSFIEWGANAIDRFIGMFAFAFFDKKKGILTLVRDRAGVKPLYYYKKGNTFIFASELKSIYQHPSFKKELNLDSLAYYFQFGYIPTPYTIYKDCYKLEAGSFATLNINNLEFEITKYWDVQDFYLQDRFDKSEDEVLEDLENILTDAVNLRMIADVPIGVFLSGGIDSSLVTALLTKDGKKINTYTIGFEDKNYNEAQHAKMVAKHFNTNHNELYITQKDMLDKVDDLPFFYDEPFGDSSAIPTMIVSKMAKSEVTVALSADGGDEAFCGYAKYFFLDRFKSIFSNSFKSKLLKVALKVTNEEIIEKINNILPKNYRQTNIKDKYNKFKRAILARNYEEMFINASSYSDPKVLKKALKVKPKAEYFSKFKMQKGLSLIDNMMLIDYKTFMADDVLVKVDRATMSVSLEGREPLLDHRIIEYLSRVDSNLKYKNQDGKYLAKQILYKYIPKEIVNKPKAGFQIPLLEWAQGDLKSLIEEYISIDKLDKDIFNIEYILYIKDRVYKGDIKYLNTIWFILMYQMWFYKWN